MNTGCASGRLNDSAGRCQCCDSYVPPPDCDNLFNNINVCGLKEAVQCADSEVPLVRLKAILGYLRRTICPEIECCITNYVKNLPDAVKDYIFQEFDRAGRQSVQYFYEYLMTTMAESLSQGLYVIGFKVGN